MKTNFSYYAIKLNSSTTTEQIELCSVRVRIFNELQSFSYVFKEININHILKNNQISIIIRLKLKIIFENRLNIN